MKYVVEKTWKDGRKVLVCRPDEDDRTCHLFSLADAVFSANDTEGTIRIATETELRNWE